MRKKENGKQILITGATGLIGSHLVEHFLKLGHHCIAFSTQDHHKLETKISSCPWHPEEILNNHAHNLPQLITQIKSADVIINLAGYSVAKGRFDKKHQAKILESRINSTKALIKLCEIAGKVPKTWIQASATGYYGETKDSITDESAKKGKGFLADVSEEWENCLEDLSMIGTPRIVIARIGFVLSKDAPAWRQLVFPIKWGLGGPLGSGNQYWSWIHIDDIVRSFEHFIIDKSEGIYNLTAPYPLPQKEVVSAIGKALNRPTKFPTPEFLLRIAMGKAADELVLWSARVTPKALLNDGFQFRYPKIEDALVELLNEN